MLIRMSDAFCASAVSHRRSSSGWKCAPISAGVSDRLCFFENTLEPFRPRCRAGYRYSSLASFRFKPCSLRRQVSTGRRTLPVRKGMPGGMPRPARRVCALFSRRYGRKAVVCQKLILSLFCARLRAASGAISPWRTSDCSDWSIVCIPLACPVCRTELICVILFSRMRLRTAGLAIRISCEATRPLRRAFSAGFGR